MLSLPQAPYVNRGIGMLVETSNHKLADAKFLEVILILYEAALNSAQKFNYIVIVC